MKTLKNLVAAVASTLFAICISCVAFAAVIPAERQLPLMVDQCGLFSEPELQYLEDRLEEISEEQRCEVAIAAVDSLGGKDITAFADDFYDYNGYGYGEYDDGLLLVISMSEREWAITTYGYAVYAFTDAGQEALMDKVLVYLSDGQYYNAFMRFADLCEDYLIQAHSGNPVDVETPRKSSGFAISFSPIMLIFCLVIGVIGAVIVTTAMKKSMKSVNKQSAADMYVVPGTLSIRKQTDQYLYQNTQKIPRSSGSSGRSGGSSTHRSSSGRSHGGSRGRF